MLSSLNRRLLKHLLVAAVRYCLKHTMHIQDLVEVAKIAFVEEACREILSSGDRVNVSRLSVSTGLHRRDIERIYKRQEVRESSQGLLGRVIGQWQYDVRFTTEDGRPKLLSCEGESSEFHSLVQSVSKDVNVGTVIFELKRRELVSSPTDGVIKLEKGVLVVGRNGGDIAWEDGFSILSKDISDISDAVQENLSATSPVNLHGRTEFDCIDPKYEHEIREWLLREGSAFHRKVGDYLSRYDCEICTDTNASSVFQDEMNPITVSVGAFSFISKEKKTGV